MRNATKAELEKFKRLQVISTREATGDPFKAMGHYEENMNVCGEAIRVVCDITLEDVLTYQIFLA